ncbi:stress responsive A/B barrel domain-containing protein [Gorgonomyces haynaldii]|nr:stress responsive A/B barrel domain-containing protein [Gorgonomyces haynaldii]
MTIKHAVLFKFNTTEEHITKAKEALLGLKSLDGVLEVDFGRTFTDRHDGYTHLLIVALRDKKALQDYAVHPQHLQAIADYIKGHAEKVIAMDIEV